MSVSSTISSVPAAAALNPTVLPELEVTCTRLLRLIAVHRSESPSGLVHCMRGRCGGPASLSRTRYPRRHPAAL